MIMPPVTKPLHGSSFKTKIFRASRRSVIAVLIALGTFGPTTVLGAHSATRSSATVAVLSTPTRPHRQPISPRRNDAPDAHPDPSRDARIIDQLYDQLMRESARVLSCRDIRCSRAQ
jgi:hypothetical protein